EAVIRVCCASGGLRRRGSWIRLGTEECFRARARARARRGDGPGWCWCCSSCSYSGPLLPGVSPAPEGPRPQEGGPIRRPRRKPRQIRDWRPAPHARRPLVAASRLRGRLSPLLEAGRALLAAAPPVAKAAVALGRVGGLQLGGEL